MVSLLRWNYSAVLLVILIPYLLNGAVSLDLHGKDADQSSTSDDQHGPCKAIDGNTSTTSHTDFGTSGNKTDPWWRLDLLEVYCLQKMTILNRIDPNCPHVNNDDCARRLAGAEVRAGLSPNRTWNRLIGTVTTEQAIWRTPWIEIIADPVVAARYVRVDLPGTNKILHMREVYLEECGDANRTAAFLDLQGKVADQSSTAGGPSSPYNAIDGDTRTSSHTAFESPENKMNPWWRLDLHDAYCLEKITILNRDDLACKDVPHSDCARRLAGAVVSAGLSPNRSSNRQIGTVTNEQTNYLTPSIEFTANPVVTARYVRVDLPGTNKILHMREIYLTEFVIEDETGGAVDFTLVTNPALLGVTGDNDATIGAYKGHRDLTAAVSFGRQLTTGGTNSGLPSGSKELQSEQLGCQLRQIQLPEVDGLDRTGVFYCEATKPGRTVTKIQTIILPMDESTVHVRPVQRTKTVNIGDSVRLEMRNVNSPNTDYRWQHDGSDVISWNDQLDVTIPRVAVTDAGVYSCFPSGQEDQRLHGITRLIVRECSSEKWGLPSCLNVCRRCYNGGVCDAITGSCICAPGFSGEHCEQVHGRNIFGQNARNRCFNSTDPHDEACRGRLFCLPDPYGCSCAAGYTGLDCMQECAQGSYGADCKQTCHCAPGKTCSKDTGECSDDDCASSYYGINCQCSSREVAPGELRATEVLQCNVSFSWTKPTCVFRGGAITGFLYQLIDVRSGALLRLLNVTEESVTLNGLSPYILYGFQIAATTIAGTGPFGELLSVTTLEAEPSAPINTDVLDVDDVSVTVTWSPPDPPNGIILNYDIAYWKSTDAGSPTLRNDVGMTSLAYRVDGLDKFTTYHVQVRAKTSAGAGPWSNIVVAFTQIGVPGFVRNLHQTNVTDRSISLAWDEPLDPMGQIAGYMVEYRITEKPYDQTFAAGSEYTREYVDDPWYRKDTFEPGTKYEFEVSAQNQENAGKRSTLAVFTQPLKDIPQPLPARILSEETTDTTVTIRLTGVDSIYIVAYVIRVQQELVKTKREAFVPRHYRDSAQDYIAAEIPDTDVTVPFTVGDSLIYGRFYNAPLVTGASYRIRIGAMSKVNDIEANVRFSTPLTVTVRAIKVLNIAAIILGGMFVILAVAVATGCVVLRKRIQHKGSSEHRIVFTQDHDHSPFSKSDIHGTESPHLRGAELPGTPHDDTGVYEHISLPPWATGLEIKWRNLTVRGEVLGKGNFGEVRAGGLNVRGKISTVAVKNLKAGATTKASEDFMAEFQTMAKIRRHPNVVGLLGACLHDASLYVVLEYLPNGNLRDYLRSACPNQEGTATPARVSPLTSSNLLTFGINISRGMEHLSNSGIIHRDLAARNILLAQDLTAKVSDFGLSRGEDIYVQQSMTRIPTRWLAIESLTHREYKSKSDVWSFGIVLWEIATFGATPYPGIQSKLLAQRLQDGYRMPKPQNCADEIYDLMMKCWQTDPHKRPSFKELSAALQAMNAQSDENIYMSPHIYENHVIQLEFDDN